MLSAPGNRGVMVQLKCGGPIIIPLSVPRKVSGRVGLPFSSLMAEILAAQRRQAMFMNMELLAK